jgi:hypothetical protein
MSTIVAVGLLIASMASTNRGLSEFDKLDCGIRRRDLSVSRSVIILFIRRVQCRQIYERAQKLQPFRASHRETFDALRLLEICGDPPPRAGSQTPIDFVAPYNASDPCVVFVHPMRGDDAANGMASRPFRSVARALHATRVACDKAPSKTIVLSGGVHFLNQVAGLRGVLCCAMWRVLVQYSRAAS